MSGLDGSESPPPSMCPPSPSPATTTQTQVARKTIVGNEWKYQILLLWLGQIQQQQFLGANNLCSGKLETLGSSSRDWVKPSAILNRRCHGHHGRHHHRHHQHDNDGRGDGTGQRGHKMWTLRPEYPTMTKHHVFIAPHSCDIRSNMGPTSHDIIISSCYQNWSKHQMKKACGPQYIFQ